LAGTAAPSSRDSAALLVSRIASRKDPKKICVNPSTHHSLALALPPDRRRACRRPSFADVRGGGQRLRQEGREALSDAGRQRTWMLLGGGTGMLGVV